MPTDVIPRRKTQIFMPGLEDEHEVGLSGVGVCVVDVTLAVSTARNAAQLVGVATSPPNSLGTLACYGTVVHSLGTPPTATFVMQNAGAELIAGAAMTGGITFQYLTADNSAVYVWANSWTGGAVMLGVSARFICIR